MNKESSINFNDLFRNNERKQDFLKKINAPLQRNFGIDVFWHGIMCENGQLNGICCTYADAFAHFWENHCYKEMEFFVSSTDLKSGYFMLDYDRGYEKYLRKVEEKYPLYHPSLYINNLPLLNSYIDYLLESNQHFNMRADETVVDMVALREKQPYLGKVYGQECLQSREKNCAFFKQMGVDPSFLKAAEKLTPREKEVLCASIERKTAVESGNELGLSPRTIQSYIVNAKNRLGILSREELLENAKILHMAGLLK